MSFKNNTHSQQTYAIGYHRAMKAACEFLKYNLYEGLSIMNTEIIAADCTNTEEFIKKFKKYLKTKKHE